MGSTLEIGSHGIRVPESSGIFSPLPEGMDFQEFEERLWETMNTILTLFGGITYRIPGNTCASSMTRLVSGSE
jgi:hypothetical protein